MYPYFKMVTSRSPTISNETFEEFNTLYDDSMVPELN